MKTQESLFRFAVSFVVLTAPVFAHGQGNTPGYLADYNYQVTNLNSMAAAQSLMNNESTETRSKSICASRAEVWAYKMNQDRNVQVGKVFIHFTAKGTADEDKAWAYHVAPYVLVNGEEMVLDHGFDVFKGKPTPLAEWTKHFGKSESCVVLDPVNNPAHLALEQYNMPNQTLMPLEASTKRRVGAPRQYPSTEGICYIRKTPMYYGSPQNVYAADLALKGKAGYKQFIRTEFKKDDVMNSCQQAMTVGFRLSNSCSNYLGIDQ